MSVPPIAQEITMTDEQDSRYTPTPLSPVSLLSPLSPLYSNRPYFTTCKQACAAAILRAYA